MNKKIFSKLDLSPNVMWEQNPMKKLTKRKNMAGYRHRGFWYCMDTERDTEYLNQLWRKGAPWKIW